MYMERGKLKTEIHGLKEVNVLRKTFLNEVQIFRENYYSLE